MQYFPSFGIHFFLLAAAASSSVVSASIRPSPLYSTETLSSLTVIESKEVLPSPTSTTIYGDTVIASTSTSTLVRTVPQPPYSVISWRNANDSIWASTRTIPVPPVKETSVFTSTLSHTSPISSTVTSDVPSVTYVPSTTITPPPNPCPTTCTISAGTVNLFYWPTNGSYEYPSTYSDAHLDYVFTSPSVYMVVNTIYGYNTAGLAGPSGTSVVFPLDLDEVSTIVPYASNTRQLSLNDLGTDCPQSEDPSVIKTAAPDGHCDPVLVAPERVKAWASPCNACGNFGLFDPPYAVTPITGGLIPETTATTTQPEPPKASSVVTATETIQTETTAPSTIQESSISNEQSTSLVVIASETSSSEVSSTGQLSTPSMPSSSESSSFSSSSMSTSMPSGTSTAPNYNSGTKLEAGVLVWFALGFVVWFGLC